MGKVEVVVTVVVVAGTVIVIVVVVNEVTQDRWEACRDVTVVVRVS